MKKINTKIAILVVLILSIGVVVPAFADSIGAFDFESPVYSVGNIDGQDGWTKTGGFDVEVDLVASFANAVGFGFGDQAMRFSNGVTSGSFGDQTFSPGLASPANETDPTHFEASFSIGSTDAAQQPGLFLSVSPDDGSGSRMSYVGFDDQADGIHVLFYDATNPGPLNVGVTAFNLIEAVTINRTSAHTVKFVIDLVPGPANDVVELYVDGNLVATGTTWEDYYRYDPEQNGNGNVVPPISKMLFRAGGSAAPSTLGNGYLIDSVSLVSGPVLMGPPIAKDECKKDGWKTFNNPTFKNQGQCVSYVQANEKAGKKN